MFNPKMLHSLHRKICASAFMLLSLCMMLNLPQAQAQGGGGFDHAATAFPLLGSHERVRCETCHIKGIFKSTPTACASCHVVGNQRDAVAMSAKHIPTPTSLGCDSCHNVSSFSAVQFNHSMVQPGFCQVCHDGVRATGLSSNHVATGGLSCDQCHSTAGFLPVPMFPHVMLNGDLTTCATCHDGHIAKGMSSNHLPRSAAALCGSCHIASTLNGYTSFAGGQIDHTGLTTACADCHGPAITGGSFTGISSIVVMPPTSPAGPNSHIPSSTICESCHLGSLPVTLMAANASHLPPGSGFATPAPSNAQIHAGVTGGCSNCHESNFVWMGVSAYPIAPASVVANAQYLGFQTRPLTAASTYSVADAAHPTTGDCSLCHVGTNYFTAAAAKPTNHIPYASTALCTSCHTTPGDFTTTPTLASIHLYAPSTSSNCAQCHGSAAASFALPAIGFSIVGLPAAHIPTTAACESCHVGAGSSIAATPVANGAKFSGSLMSHAGITSNCAACHGPGLNGSSFTGISQIVSMPATSPMGSSSHIPSSTTCETCHLGSTPAGMVAASATKTAPGTLFATPVPTTAQIHTGITSGCSSCHDTNDVWMGMSAYPIAPTVLTSGAQYTGFQARPMATAGSYSVADASHPTTGDCSLCHTGTNYFTGAVMPANHIPIATGAACNACHTSTDYSVLPTLTNIHAYAPSTSTNCAQCHGSAAASFAIPAASFTIVGLPGAHVPTSAACESCHVGAGSSIAATPVVNGAKFSGSLMSHAGITSNCVACHGPSITGSSFTGITKIVVLPPTSPMGASSHIPSSTTCETCHLATTPAAMVAANATKTAPGTLFATPAPTTSQIHTGMTSGCTSCHEANDVWMGMSAYPITPTVLTAGAQYMGFQTRPVAAASTYGVADAAHTATGDCVQCHASTAYFSATATPSNHIPFAASAQCAACHTSTDFSVLPTLTNIHANAPSTSTNCVQCHGSAAASFAIPAASFTIVGLPVAHIPTSAACESCHVGAGSSIAATPVLNGAKFSGSLMSHTGITSNCVACHGPSITGSTFAGVSQIVVMPATSPMGASAHIPSGTTCETCHLGSTPAGMVAASATKTAPGTLFATPAPTTTQIHTGITAGCSSCHEASYVWMGMSAYPIAPSVLTSGAQYTGFQVRPMATAGTYTVADAAHPTTGDCSQCHTGTAYFSATVTPANHIPYASTAQCTACHTSTDYSAMPTLANIHANAPSTTTNCAQCHAAAVVAGFAIPAANFAIVGPPATHFPITTACEACHVGSGSSVAATPVPNGAKFSGSLMSHTGITSGCVTCHGPTVTGASFAGVSKIVVMPAVTPMGASTHIPSSTTCETCHIGTVPTAMVAAAATKTAPGTLFAAPAPTTAQIHTGITSGCASCHEASYVWMGMSAYPIAPTVMTTGAQYTGFQVRPMTAAGTYTVADAAHPTTGDCSQCHSGTAYFSGIAKPTGHMPTSLACATCHIVAGDYSVAGLASLTILHTGISSGCITCHTAGTGKGPFAGCTTQAACASPVPVTYQPKVMPLLTGGSATSPSASTHVPSVGIACELCHSPTVFTVFSGMNMKSNTPAHTAVASATCMSCHELAYVWYGVSMKDRPSGHHTGTDCKNSGCHSATKFSGFSGQMRPLLRAAAGTINQRFLPGVGLASSLFEGDSLVFSHAGVAPGQCQTCHNGQLAQGLPPVHLQVRMSCDSCHRTTAWKPAQFSHQGVLPGQCQVCHNSAAATGKPAGHFVTARSCDACHRTVAWLPVMYTHISPLYQAQPGNPTCVSCHITNGELIPRQMRGNSRPKPVPVHTGP